MEALGIDNILSDGEVETLFTPPEEETKENTQNTSSETEETKNQTTEDEIVPETLFSETSSSESVSSEETQNKEKEDTNSNKESVTSPKNFYSSIAGALKEDGIFPDLDNDSIEAIKDADDFAKIVKEQVGLQLDERQKRIDEALSNGVEPSVIKQYETTIQYLDNITDEDLNAEDENGENLRKNLIFQDYLNRGYSKEQATRKLQKSLDSGNDIEDAKEALEGNKDYFNKGYKQLLNEAKQKAESEEKQRVEQANELKKSILEDQKIFGDLSLDKSTRQKIYDSVVKPSYKDKDTGELITAVQKYERENRLDFIKKLGTLFILTDGFKTLDNLVKPEVTKGVKKGIKELEKVLTTSPRMTGGNLQFVGGVDNSQSFTNNKWDLDI